MGIKVLPLRLFVNTLPLLLFPLLGSEGIKRIINKIPNATLLNYGFLDGGFYTAANIFPSERFFCQLNIELPEMTESLTSALSEGRVDFIVSSHKLKNSYNYELVASEDFPYEKMTFTYYLYRKIGLTN